MSTNQQDSEKTEIGIIASTTQTKTRLNLKDAQERVKTAQKKKVSCWSCLLRNTKSSDSIQMVLRRDLSRRVRGAIFAKETYLLKALSRKDKGKKTLVLDLDETLVHSSFMPIKNPDFIVPVTIDNHTHNVYVLKRPGVDEFLNVLGEIYEIVVFTASLAKYADPVINALDKQNVVRHRLFRESCVKYKEGNFVKDLSLLGRDLKDVIIIDNSPSCYLLHPSNAIPVTSWFSDTNDTELLELIPFLKDLVHVDNVTLILQTSHD